MKVFAEISLTNFEFWSGAKANAERLTNEEIEQIGKVLEYIYEEVESVTINNLFWFGFESVAEMLGYKYDVENDIIIR